MHSQVDKDVVIADLLVTGNNHVVFNASLLTIICKLYHDVTFNGEREHVQRVHAMVGCIEKVTFKPHESPVLPNSPVLKVIPWIKKKINDARMAIEIVRQADKKNTTVIFSCLSTTTLFVVSLIAARVKVPIYIVVHGEIEFLFINRLGFLKHLKGLLYKRVVHHLKPNVKLIVLSKFVRKSLLSKYSIEGKKILSIEHPIIQVETNRRSLAYPLQLAHIGSAMIKKNSGQFFNLATALDHDIRRERLTFVLIGKDIDCVSRNDAVKRVLKSNQSIPADIYESEIQKSHYAIFLFEEPNYVYRVSGAVMDCLIYNKPIIALNHKYINYLFEEGGDIGFLCENIEEIIETLKRLADNYSQFTSRYQKQQENLRLLASRFSVQSVLKDLQRQL